MMNGYVYGINHFSAQTGTVRPAVGGAVSGGADNPQAGEIASGIFLKMIISRIMKNEQIEGIFGGSFQGSVMEDVFSQNIAQQLAKDDIFGFNRAMSKGPDEKNGE